MKQTLKQCGKCGEQKPIEQFYKKKGRAAPASRCIPCFKSYGDRRKSAEAASGLKCRQCEAPLKRGTTFCSKRCTYASGFKRATSPSLRSSGRYYIGHYRIHARAVAEQVIGRPLRKTEVIHHINLVKTDDRPENLYLFRSKSAHTKWHQYLNRNNLHGTILASNLHLYV